MKLKIIASWLHHHEEVLWIIGLVVLIRLPSLFEPAWYGDETIYLTIGQGIRKGLVLYRDITDYPNKPPLVYLIAAVVQTVFGFRFLLLWWNAINAVIIFWLAKILCGGKRWAAYGAVGLFMILTATPLLEGLIANGEIFMIMPTTAGMFLLWDGTLRRRSGQKWKMENGKFFLAGVFFALGFLFKIPVAADIMAAGLFFLMTPLLDSGKFAGFFRRIAVFAGGFGSLVMLTLLILAWQGVNLIDLLKIIMNSGGYVTVWQQQTGIWSYLSFSSLGSRLVLVLLLSWLFLQHRKHFSQQVLLVCLWTIWALFGALLSARPYAHYLLQVVPPVVLGAGLLMQSTKKGGYWLLPAVGIMVVIAYLRFNFSLWPFYKYYNNFLSLVAGKISREEYMRIFDGRMPRNYQVAKYIKMRTGAGDRIYVWGTEPDIYVLADRLPVGRLTTSFHVEDLKEYARLSQELAQVLPPYIVVMENEQRNFLELKILLETRYMIETKIHEANVHRLMYDYDLEQKN